jgi:hypothetical protein
MGGTKTPNLGAFLPPGAGMGTAAALPIDEPAYIPQGFGLGAAAAQGGGFDPTAYAPDPDIGLDLADVGQARQASVGSMGAAAMGSVGPARAVDYPQEAAPLSAFEQAASEQQGRLDTLQAFLADNPVQHGSAANPMRPIAEQQAQNFYGGGALEVAPFQYQSSAQAIPRNEGENDEDYAARVSLFQMADEQGQYETWQRGVAEQQEAAGTLGDVRDIGRKGHLGMAEATVQAAEGKGEAEVNQLTAAAQAQAQAADTSRLAIEEARAMRQEAQDRADHQWEAVKLVQVEQAKARAKLQALPDLDPRRTFKSMSGGAKFAAILGALAGGWIGSTKTIDRLDAMAAQDLEVQKAERGMAFDLSAKADEAVSSQMSLYKDLRDSVGDAADPVWYQMQMSDAAEIIEAQLAETTVPLARAQLQETLVGIKEKIDAKQREIDTLLVKTPDRVATSFDPVGARARRAIEKQIIDERNFQQDLTKVGIDVEQKGLDRQGRIDEKQMEGRAKVEAQVKGEQVKADMDIKKASDEWGAVETLVGDFLKANPDDIAGAGAPLGGNQNDRIRTRSFKNALELLATSGFTGATATERQAEQIKELVEGGMWEMTDDAFRTRLGEIMNIASSRRRYYQNQLGSPDPRIGDPTKGLSSFQAE